MGTGGARELVGLIPAAGQARRIAPIPISKEIFPVGFQPAGPAGEPRPKAVCQYLLERMRLAGINKAYLVLREGKWDIPAYLGDGSALGMDLAYLMMRIPYGAPYTLDQAYPFVRHATVALGYPDILFAPEDAYVSLLARLNETDAEAVLGLFPTDEPWRTDVVEKDSAGRIRRIVVKPKQTALRESWVMAVWGPAFTQFLHDHLAAQAPPPAGPAGGEEAYVGHVLQAALEAGLRVESVSFPGGEFLDIGTPESLLRAVRRCIAGPSSF